MKLLLLKGTRPKQTNFKSGDQNENLLIQIKQSILLTFEFT